MAAHDVIAVGDLMIDVRVAEDALSGGHVSGKVQLGPGGSAATAAVWARSAGAAAAVVGRIGNDFAGAALARGLAQRGVDPLLAVDATAATGCVLGLGRTVLAERGANALLTADDVPAALNAGAILVSGFVLLHEDTGAAGLAALERADAEWVAVDAASARLLGAFGREPFFRATERASVLLLNEDAAFELTDEAPDGAVAALAPLYRFVCVTLGEEGAIASLDGKVMRAAAPQIQGGDPTGAGDAFAGTLLAGLARGAPPERLLDEACAAGARAASLLGSWPPE